MPKKSRIKKARQADGEEGILISEFGSNRVIFRQYDKTKTPWGIRDYYLSHPDLRVRIRDKSAIFSKSRNGDDVLDVNTSVARPKSKP